MSELIEMQVGKIYFISFSGVELVVRYKKSTTTEFYFFSHLQYWCGRENYHTAGYCVHSGIEMIREATNPEKHNLFRHEVEKGDV